MNFLAVLEKMIRRYSETPGGRFQRSKSSNSTQTFPKKILGKRIIGSENCPRIAKQTEIPSLTFL